MSFFFKHVKKERVSHKMKYGEYLCIHTLIKSTKEENKNISIDVQNN